MMKQNYSVKAVLRTDKKRKDGTCPINYRITINSKVTRLSSGHYEEESNWNATLGIVKGSKSSYLNSAIDKDVSRIKDFIREQRSLGVHLEGTHVKNFWSTTDSDDFVEFFDGFCEKRFVELAEGTQYHYLLLRKRLLSFRKVLKLSQIDLSFVEGFDNYLKTKQKTGESGIWKRHKNLNAVLNYAVKNKRIVNNPYNDFKIINSEPKLSYLTADELISIDGATFDDLQREKGLSITRDMFLFACYTGLRFSDVTALNNDHIIDDKYISIKQQKTKNLVQIPLVLKAKLILEKYRTKDDKFIFPYRANVTINRDLKDVAVICKINKKLHFHLARHTFASTMANSNVNSFKIMKLLGHRDIRMTQRYFDNNVEDLAASLDSIDVFK